MKANEWMKCATGERPAREASSPSEDAPECARWAEGYLEGHAESQLTVAAVEIAMGCALNEGWSRNGRSNICSYVDGVCDSPSCGDMAVAYAEYESGLGRRCVSTLCYRCFGRRFSPNEHGWNLLYTRLIHYGGDTHD